MRLQSMGVVKGLQKYVKKKGDSKKSGALGNLYNCG
jgi:hypothetical protein